MKFSIVIGQNSEHRIDYERNWFSGNESLVADGELVFSRDSKSLATHFNMELRERREFVLKGNPLISVVFEKERPLMFAGLRPQTYRVWVAGALVHETKGY